MAAIVHYRTGEIVNGRLLEPGEEITEASCCEAYDAWVKWFAQVGTRLSAKPQHRWVLLDDPSQVRSQRSTRRSPAPRPRSARKA